MEGKHKRFRNILLNIFKGSKILEFFCSYTHDINTEPIGFKSHRLSSSFAIWASHHTSSIHVTSSVKCPEWAALTLKGMLAPSSKFCNQQQVAEIGLLASNVTALPHVRSSLTLSKRAQHLNFFDDVFSMSQLECVKSLDPHNDTVCTTATLKDSNRFKKIQHLVSKNILKELSAHFSFRSLEEKLQKEAVPIDFWQCAQLQKKKGILGKSGWLSLQNPILASSSSSSSSGLNPHLPLPGCTPSLHSWNASTIHLNQRCAFSLNQWRCLPWTLPAFVQNPLEGGSASSNASVIGQWNGINLRNPFVSMSRPHHSESHAAKNSTGPTCQWRLVVLPTRIMKCFWKCGCCPKKFTNMTAGLMGTDSLKYRSYSHGCSWSVCCSWSVPSGFSVCCPWWVPSSFATVSVCCSRSVLSLSLSARHWQVSVRRQIPPSAESSSSSILFARPMSEMGTPMALGPSCISPSSKSWLCRSFRSYRATRHGYRRSSPHPSRISWSTGPHLVASLLIFLPRCIIDRRHLPGRPVLHLTSIVRDSLNFQALKHAKHSFESSLGNNSWFQAFPNISTLRQYVVASKWLWDSASMPDGFSSISMFFSSSKLCFSVSTWCRSRRSMEKRSDSFCRAWLAQPAVCDSCAWLVAKSWALAIVAVLGSLQHYCHTGVTSTWGF